ncbi:MAG: ABC transporter ATP-binding protein [Hydrogenophaga sp.]|jgi:branched-chain amino acid transport system ATP-binding protein|nr:ABC transporter ATP-binding protein [Hydrogenophaga sp.]
MTALLTVENLVKRFRGIRASDGIDFDLRPGEIHAVIGPNGAGKTTFINQLAGELAPDSGRILLDGKDITKEPVHRRAALGLARSYQISAVFDELSVLDNVMLAAQAHQGHSFRFFNDAGGDENVAAPAREAIRIVGLEDAMHRSVSELAHGAKRQLELAMVIATKPRLMLLDEPMAGTGPTESREIVALLKRLRGTAAIVLIEHDLEAVFALADRISVMVYGKVIATGSCDEIRADAAVREAYIGDGEAVL